MLCLIILFALKCIADENTSSMFNGSVMLMKMRWHLTLLFLVHLRLTHQTEPCTKDTFYLRTFSLVEKGDVFVRGTSQSASENLGSCRTVEEHVEKMIEYYESFGIDLTPYRENPFSTYTTGDFEIVSNAPSPKADYRLVSSTFYEYASAPNTQMAWFSWGLTARRDLSGYLREIKAGNLAIYGMLRLKENGVESCIEYKSGSPGPAFSLGGVLNPVDLKLYNKDWGYGKFSGVLSIKNATVDFRYSMTFPQD